MLPDFIRRVRQDRRQYSSQRLSQQMKRGLRGTALPRIGPLAIEPVLDYVQVERAQFHGTEIVNCMVDTVKLVDLISLGAGVHHSIELRQRPTVQLEHLR